MDLLTNALANTYYEIRVTKGAYDLRHLYNYANTFSLFLISPDYPFMT